MAPVKYTATVWREQIPWRRTDTLVSVTSTTGLFWICEGINNKWVTTHTEAHPTMQCVLFLLFYPFTSPNFPAPFSGHLFFPLMFRDTPTHCPDVFQVNIENGAEGRNPPESKQCLWIIQMIPNLTCVLVSTCRADVPSGTRGLFRELWTQRHRMAPVGLCSRAVSARDGVALTRSNVFIWSKQQCCTVVW